MPFGQWAGGERLPDGSIQMPWYELSPEPAQFVDDVRGAGWVTPFDWPAWLSSPDGERLVRDPQAVADASPDDLGRLLTALVRQERFGDGTLAAANDSGLLAAIARRAEILAATLEHDDPAEPTSSSSTGQS